jgi:hypothetical protein
MTRQGGIKPRIITADKFWEEASGITIQHYDDPPRFCMFTNLADAMAS